MADAKLQSFAGASTDPLVLAKMGVGNFNRTAGAHLSKLEDERWLESHPCSYPGLLKLQHLSPTIGSVVLDVDLSKPTPELVAALRHALLLRKVLFFHDQALNTDQLLAFTRNFGELEIHPFSAAKEGHDEVLLIQHAKDSPGVENQFHSDVSWRQDPSLGSVLHCQETPEVGGDTIFVDMHAALLGLPDNLKEQIMGKTAEHDWHYFRMALQSNGIWSDDKIEQMQKQYPPQHHPIIRTHPETGRNLLYVNRAFTKQIDGMEWAESQQLLQQLYAHAANPEYQVRFQWRAGSVAFWDNRSCQHYAISDYWPSRRVMERVTVKGDQPYFSNSSARAKL